MSVKNNILNMLKADQAEYISGEYICQQLNVSRTAIWKYIEQLRRDGYDIEARPRAGYRLLFSPDILEPSEWISGISTKIIGKKVKYFKAVTSTNDIGKDLARQGTAEGTVIVAEEQTNGKGRLGRTWQAPPQSGLCFSVVLYPKVNPMEVTQFTVLTAVAIVGALAKAYDIEAKVKWPNDVYIDGLKVCGILAEMAAEADRVKYLVLGIGVNVNQTRDDFKVLDTATSVREKAGNRVSRVNLLKAVLEELDRLYYLWQTKGFAPLKLMWKEAALWYGSNVTVNGLNEAWHGKIEDIDDNGELILKLDDGSLKKFYSGEVSLRLAK